MKGKRVLSRKSLLYRVMTICLVLGMSISMLACGDNPGGTAPSSGGGGGGGGGGGKPSDGVSRYKIELYDGALLVDLATTLDTNKPYDLQITALRDATAIANAYAGTVDLEAFVNDQITTSVTLPFNYAYTVTDTGVHLFAAGVLFKTQGIYKIKASDVDFNQVSSSVSDIKACPLGVCAAPPIELTLTASPASMFVGASTSLTATVLSFIGEPFTDANLNGVYDLGETFIDTNGSTVYDPPVPLPNVQISFASDIPSAGIDPTEGISDINGQVIVTMYAPDAAGAVNVTAMADTLTTTLQVPISALGAAGIRYISSSPQVIGVIGSGTAESSTITFQLIGADGQPMGNPRYPMVFTLEGPQGDEYLSPTNQLTDSTGKAQTTLHSGNVSGPTRIFATVSVPNPVTGIPDILTASSAQVYIHAGPPSGNHLGIASVLLNLPGLVFYGATTNISAYVGDRYGNPVVENTAVYFTTEAGIINAVTKYTDQLGVATTTLETAAPAPWDTAWEDPYDPINYPYGEYWGAGTYDTPTPGTLPVPDTLRDEYDTQHGGSPAFPSNGLYNLPNPMDGYATIIAMTIGEESYKDTNANGKWDMGEYVFDIGEPYIDANDNGKWDSGESYRDFDRDGVYDVPNGVWNSRLMLWVPIHIIFSSGVSSGTAWMEKGLQECQAGPVVGSTCWVLNNEIYTLNGGIWNSLDGWSVASGSLKEFTAYACDINHNPTADILDVITGDNCSASPAKVGGTAGSCAYKIILKCTKPGEASMCIGHDCTFGTSL